MLTMKPKVHLQPTILWGFLRIIGIAACGVLIGLAFGLIAKNVIIGLILGMWIGVGTGASVECKFVGECADLDQILWAATPLLVFALITLIFWIQTLH